MEPRPLSAAERAELTEFRRTRREAELFLTLKKLIVDASGRETDKNLLKKGCDFARRVHASGVLVASGNVAAAKRLLRGSGVNIVCLVGGTGECMPSVKRFEAKRAVQAGAKELRLVPSHAALMTANRAALKREMKRVRRAAKGCPVVLSLEDRTLSEEEISLGVKTAAECGLHGVCVRGETPLLLHALEAGAGKLFSDCSGAENGPQLLTLVHLGAARVTSAFPERIAEDLFSRSEP